MTRACVRMRELPLPWCTEYQYSARHTWASVYVYMHDSKYMISKLKILFMYLYKIFDLLFFWNSHSNLVKNTEWLLLNAKKQSLTLPLLWVLNRRQTENISRWCTSCEGVVGRNGGMVGCGVDLTVESGMVSMSAGSVALRCSGDHTSAMSLQKW